MTSSTADIRIKRVYEPPGADDGARVLVDRLWPRGVRKDALDMSLWLKDIAPSPDLRRWFGHDPARFADFAERYRLELSGNGAAVEKLLDLVGQGRLTLLYAAHDTAHNHAVVLAEYLRGLSAKKS